MAQTPIPQDIYNALYPAVGSLILNWALFESSIEKWVAIIYHNGGGKWIERKIPRMYSPKVKFLQKCFTERSELAPFKDQGNNLLDRAEPLSKVRFTVTHGAISDWDAKNNKVEFVRLDLDNSRSIHTIKPEWLSVQDVLDAGFGSIRLARDSLSFCNDLLDAFKP